MSHDEIAVTLRVDVAPERRYVYELAAELGLVEHDLEAMARRVRWDRARFDRERLSPGWEDRFRGAVAEAEARRREAAIETSTTRALGLALAHGPRAAAALTEPEILPKLDQRLRRLALELDPAIHGGRLICGPTGVGKSLALALVLRRLMRAEAAQRYDAADDYTRDNLALVCRDHVWTRAQDLPVARLQTRLGDGEAELVSRALAADLLVLDDLGWESQRAGAADVVLEVLAARYDAGSPTLVTSGLQLAAVRERYGDALIRRICEAGGLPGRVLDLWAPEARA